MNNMKKYEAIIDDIFPVYLDLLEEKLPIIEQLAHSLGFNLEIIKHRLGATIIATKEDTNNSDVLKFLRNAPIIGFSETRHREFL